MKTKRGMKPTVKRPRKTAEKPRTVFLGEENQVVEMVSRSMYYEAGYKPQYATYGPFLLVGMGLIVFVLYEAEVFQRFAGASVDEMGAWAVAGIVYAIAGMVIAVMTVRWYVLKDDTKEKEGARVFEIGLIALVGMAMMLFTGLTVVSQYTIGVSANITLPIMLLVGALIEAVIVWKIWNNAKSLPNIAERYKIVGSGPYASLEITLRGFLMVYKGKARRAEWEKMRDMINRLEP